MTITFSTFIENAYHYFIGAITNDSITKIKLEKGNVVIISEERFNCLLDLLSEK